MINDPAQSIEWPPIYRIKKHRLARSVKLRAKKPHGLEITVPPRFNVRDIPAILEEHRSWITKQLIQLQSASTDELPEQISMASLGETWKVTYMPCKAKLEIMERPSQEIVVVGKIPSNAVCRAKLTDWLKWKAKLFLSEQLSTWSRHVELPFESVTIRDQKTVWGSCTSSCDINLNYKLIFLPLHLTHHVMIHELCHTRHLNHSERFWDLVGSFDANWREHRRQLRKADSFIPAWI